MTEKSIYKSEHGRIEVLSFYEVLLEDWCQPNKNHHVTTTYGKTFVVESGDEKNPTMVLLHGSSSNSAMWKADVEAYSKKYHVFAIDIIGECGNSDETRPDFKTNHYSTWLKELFERLNITKAAVVGCSLGGWIAIDFTTQFPEKVDKLVLIATAGISQIRMKTIFLIILTSMFGEWGFKKLNKIVYGNLEIDELALEFATLIKNYYKPRTDVLPVFENKKLISIQAPVYFIGGANDCFYDSGKTASRMSETVMNFTSDVLSNTGHVIVNQTKNIMKFLE